VLGGVDRQHWSGVAGLLLLGCAGSTPHVMRLRPAGLAERFPIVLSLDGQWSGPRQRELKRLVSQKLAAVPGGLVRTGSSGPLVLSAAVEQAPAHEEVTRLATTCSDTTKTPVVRYGCVRFTRRVKASLAVTFWVTKGGVDVLRQQLALSTNDRSESAVAEERVTSLTTAPAIDTEKLYLGLLEALAERIARVLVPYTEELALGSLHCGDEREACEEGFERLARCDYAGAQAKFQAAVAALTDGGRRAAALWGLALALELDGRFAESRRALEQGEALAPLRPEFKTQLGRLPQDEHDAAALAEQVPRLTPCALKASKK